MLPLSFTHGEFFAQQPGWGNLHENKGRPVYVIFMDTLLISLTSLCFCLCFIYIAQHKQPCILLLSQFLFTFLAFLSGFY